MVWEWAYSIRWTWSLTYLEPSHTTWPDCIRETAYLILQLKLYDSRLKKIEITDSCYYDVLSNLYYWLVSKKIRFKYRNLCLCICCWLSTDPLVESTSRRLIPRRLTFVLQNIHVILVKQCKEVQENNTWSGSFIDWEGRGSEGEKRGGGVSWLWLISKCGWYSRLNLFSSFAIKMFDCFANNFFQNISINSRAKWSKVLLVLSSLLALFATPSHLIWCVWVCHIVLICSKLPILLSWLCSF